MPYTLPGFPNPLTTEGDLIVGGASGAPERLPVGSHGQVATVVGGAPAWADPPGGGSAQTHFPVPLHWPDAQVSGTWVVGSPDAFVPTRYPGVWLLNTSNALGDEVSWTMAIPSGTYSLLLQQTKDTCRGIFTVYAGTSVLAEVDAKAGSFAFTTERYDGIVVASAQTTLRIKVTGSSGSDHYITPLALWLVKTA